MRKISHAGNRKGEIPGFDRNAGDIDAPGEERPWGIALEQQDYVGPEAAVDVVGDKEIEVEIAVPPGIAGVPKFAKRLRSRPCSAGTGRGKIRLNKPVRIHLGNHSPNAVA